MQVERAKKRAAAQAAAQAREAQSQRGWLSWAWGGGGGDSGKKGPDGEQIEEDEDMRGGFNEEEQEALRALVVEQEDALKSGKLCMNATVKIKDMLRALQKFTHMLPFGRLLPFIYAYPAVHACLQRRRRRGACVQSSG